MMVTFKEKLKGRFRPKQDSRPRELTTAATESSSSAAPMEQRVSGVSQSERETLLSEESSCLDEHAAATSGTRTSVSSSPDLVGLAPPIGTESLWSSPIQAHVATVGITKYRAAYEAAVKEFETNYKAFAERNKLFISIESGIQSAAERAQKEDNVHRSAEIFRSEITEVLRVKTKKDSESEKKLKSRLCHFAVKLFPMVKIALSFAGSVAEVRQLASHADI